MAGQYILDAEGNPIPEPDLLKWGQWIEHTERRVDQDKMDNGAFVSTVFLGLDHSFFGSPPLLWETMIFGGPEHGYEERYSSRADAVAGHAKAVALASK